MSPSLNWDKALDSLVLLRMSIDSWLSTMGSRLPPEHILRSLFEAVLRLDEQSYTLFNAVFSTADPAQSKDTWPVLAEYLRVTTRIRKFSRHGLANVGHFLANMDSFSNLICLGLTATTHVAAAANNDASGLAPLVVELMASRLVSTAALKRICESMATIASTASRKTSPAINQQSLVNLFTEIIACSKNEPSLPLARLNVSYRPMGKPHN